MGEEVAAQLDHAIARIRAIASGRDLSQEQAVPVAEILKELAESDLWDSSNLRIASPGEELAHELAAASGVPSLYLVSDGAGTSSFPHCHGTWTVIAGIRGQELNVLYRVRDAERGTAAPVEQVCVEAGDTLFLSTESIHSTEVIGTEPTFHLHLYGCPLHEVPSALARRYQRIQVVRNGLGT